MSDQAECDYDLVSRKMLATEQMLAEALSALRHQAQSPAVMACPEADTTVRQLQLCLAHQRASLRCRNDALGHAPARTRPGGRARASISTQRASSAIERSHALLQELALAYLELQTESHSAGDLDTAALAAHGYDEAQGLIRDQISRARPRVAAADLAEPTGLPPGVVGGPNPRQRRGEALEMESAAGVQR